MPFAQWGDVGRRNVLEFIHMDHQLVSPGKSLVADLKRVEEYYETVPSIEIDLIFSPHKYTASLLYEFACE